MKTLQILFNFIENVYQKSGKRAWFCFGITVGFYFILWVRGWSFFTCDIIFLKTYLFRQEISEEVYLKLASNTVFGLFKNTEPPDSLFSWKYQKKIDEMSGKPVVYASLISSNTVNFKFPYNGNQNATLKLRNHPRFGKDVIFSIEKGQILSTNLDGSISVLVRFDDEAPKTFSANPSEDRSDNIIFIRNYEDFLNKLIKAKRLRISMSIYQEGSPVFEFDVSKFEQNRYKPKE